MITTVCYTKTLAHEKHNRNDVRTCFTMYVLTPLEMKKFLAFAMK